MPDAPSQFQIRGDAVLSTTGELWAAVSHVNPMESSLPRGRRVVAWSGWYGEGADPAAGAFPRDFRTWTPAAWNLLRERLDAWTAAAAPQDALILRPHARHVLSDAQACALVLRDVADERIHILLDPVNMLEPAMLRDVEDHIARILQLASWPRIAGVVVTGAELLGDQLRPSPAGTAITPGVVDALVNRFAPDAARFYPV